MARRSKALPHTHPPTHTTSKSQPEAARKLSDIKTWILMHQVWWQHWNKIMRKLDITERTYLGEWLSKLLYNPMVGYLIFTANYAYICIISGRVSWYTGGKKSSYKITYAQNVNSDSLCVTRSQVILFFFFLLPLHSPDFPQWKCVF